MQSENFDNKMKQAAEQHHPEYDEKAWTKMEKLLDRHLPQKDNRRRSIIFFMLLFLLAGGGTWLIISKPWQPGHQTLTANTPGKQEVKPSAGATKEMTEINSTAEKKNNKETTEAPVITNEKENIPAESATNIKQKIEQNSTIADKKIAGNTSKQEKQVVVRKERMKQTAGNIDIVKTGKSNGDNSSSVNNTIISSPVNNSNDNTPGNDKIKTTVDQPVNDNNNDIAKVRIVEPKKDNITEPPTVADKKDMTKKSSNKKRNSFFFSLSAGPDVSSIGFGNPGKVKLLAGAGFGYTFKDRLTLRTGFYTGRKIYSASRDDYKPDVTPPNSMYIANIDADCKVFEIPVNLAYTFSQSKKHNLFAAAGLSSYIMKKEQYVYLYKWPNGSSYPYTKSVNDEYKHFFSVLTLSGGYEYKINETFSIAAEPYIKLPLKGVGYGKVKLNSAGVLFSMKMNPFQSPSKK